MTVAALVLGEPLTTTKLLGAAAILSGVALTRLERAIVATPTES
jgi:drug/metabolite transporter (DMT)-like permease